MPDAATESDAPFARAVTLDGRAIAVAAGPAAGRRALFAGALHYFRTEPKHWSRSLAAMRALGFTFVDTAVPWNLHERVPGRLDFTGPRDLGAFLDACAGEGLGVLLRVGPTVGCELWAGGLPERIVADPAMQARSGRGTKVVALDLPRGYPLPSYASRRFLEEVAAFYRALAEVVAPRFAPAGPVALVQIDHQQGGFLRAGPFCADYHPDALARFADEHDGAAPPTHLPHPAPQSPEALAPILDWLAFRERRIPAILSTLSALLTQAGIGAGALRLHGFAAQPPVVYDVAAAERAVDLAAAHFLDGRADYSRTRDRARYLAGSSRFPLAAPLSFGSSPWGPPLGDDDAIASLLTALMHGAAGFSGTMAVGRDRWIGGALDPHGQPRPALAGPLAKVLAALHNAGWSDLEHAPRVGLLIPRDYLRLALATSALGPAAPFAERLRMERAAAPTDRYGFDGPIQRELPEVTRALTAALARAQLPFVIVEGSADPEQLARLAALVVPTFDFLDLELAARLRRFSDHGGYLLSGPRRPTRDAAMQHAEITLPGDRFDAAALADPAALDSFVTRLAAAMSEGPRARAVGDSAPLVDVALHTRKDGAPALLFVAGSTPTARVEVPAGATFTDALTGERFAGATLEVPLGAHAVRLLVAE